jgi:hypothetical protein
MDKLTVRFGILLALIGFGAFFWTGGTHPTALIPALIGMLLVILGRIAKTEDVKKRMIAMHIAVTVALLGFLGTANGFFQTLQILAGKTFDHPVAVIEKGGTFLVCFVYVVLCVRSFIAARKARTAEAVEEPVEGSEVA